jgi:nucleoside-diphosphate-sugar epimerase
VRRYLIGARGRLGRAIAAEYAGIEIMALERRIYREWTQPGAADKVARYFDAPANEGATIFVASGLLDPGLSSEALMQVNYRLPRNVIDGATKSGIEVVTFGTVMEALLTSKNAYIQSKAALGEYVGSVACATCPVIHAQIHTLYGFGEPSPFMFLGQMLSAIRGNMPFKMTSGRQLREYHHLADEAKAIRLLAEHGMPGISNLSHGKPVQLKDIAQSVFQTLGREDLLHVGALPEPQEENYEQVLKPVKILRRVEFRDTLPAIVQYMNQCHSFLGDVHD